MILSDEIIDNLLRVTSKGYMHHRERRDLEYKEQFNLAGLGGYFRDFAGFANNCGGCIIFGVSDSPKKPVGLSKKALEQFGKIDPERISRYLLDIFSPNINWDQNIYKRGGKYFGVFYIEECITKPVIAKKNEGPGSIIKSGEIYYRYSGRTQTIEYAELHNIIDGRIQKQNATWLDLHKKIAKIGPYNAAILDTDRGIIEKDEKQMLVIEDSLLKKIKMIKAGSFKEKKGAKALRLVGDVKSIGAIEISKTVTKKLLERYPLTYAEVAREIKRALPYVKLAQINRAIKENNLKNDKSYSDYNFRSKLHQDGYEKTGKLPQGTPSVYNQAAADFLIKVLRVNT